EEQRQQRSRREPEGMEMRKRGEKVIRRTQKTVGKCVNLPGVGYEIAIRERDALGIAFGAGSEKNDGWLIGAERMSAVNSGRDKRPNPALHLIGRGNARAHILEINDPDLAAWCNFITVQGFDNTFELGRSDEFARGNDCPQNRRPGRRPEIGRTSGEIEQGRNPAIRIKCKQRNRLRQNVREQHADVLTAARKLSKLRAQYQTGLNKAAISQGIA